MPLHDWNESKGWDGVRIVWIVELFRFVKPQLPEGYRAYIGSTPALTVGAVSEKADVAVRHWRPEPPPELTPPQAAAEAHFPEPDNEVATLTLDPQTALYIAVHNRMVAAIELISPRNKDRPSARALYLARYLGYCAHLLLVDVHRRPLGFSFADALAQELNIKRPTCPAPLAASYRVGEPAATGGRMIAIWQRQLTVAQPLPTMPLPLSVFVNLSIDLESTYCRAAADAYLP